MLSGGGAVCLACSGDNIIPFIVGGVVVAALVVAVLAFALMRRGH